VGTVFDVNHAVIQRADVRVINEKRRKEQKGATSEIGQYRFESLEPGAYTLTNGFKSFTKTGVELRADEQLRLDVTLEVGAAGGVVLLPENAKARQGIAGSLVNDASYQEGLPDPSLSSSTPDG